MKTILSLAACLVFGSAFSQAPTINGSQVFITNFFTRQMTTMTGSYNKKTGDTEKGELILTSSSNLRYLVNPPDLSIGYNEEKSWTGSLMPDEFSLPLPGITDAAWLSGTYDITYKGTNPNDPQGDLISINTQGTQVVNFSIQSMNLDFDCGEQITMYPGQLITVHATGFPSEGTYTWSYPTGLNVTGDMNSSQITINPLTGYNDGSIMLTYTIQGIQFSKSLMVHFVNISIPETILVDSGVSEVDLIPENENYSFSFVAAGNGFTIAPDGGDGFLISLSPQVSNINDDPFATGNLFYVNNMNLGFEYPNLNSLEAGQGENVPLPTSDGSETLGQNNNSTPSNPNLIYGNTPNNINPDKSFARPINIALKSNPSVVIGTVSVTLNN